MMMSEMYDSRPVEADSSGGAPLAGGETSADLRRPGYSGFPSPVSMRMYGGRAPTKYVFVPCSVYLPGF